MFQTISKWREFPNIFTSIFQFECIKCGKENRHPKMVDGVNLRYTIHDIRHTAYGIRYMVYGIMFFLILLLYVYEKNTLNTLRLHESCVY